MAKAETSTPTAKRKPPKARAACWTARGDLVVLTDRGFVTLRDGAVVAEGPAAAGARRVVALPSGAILSVARDGKAKLVDGAQVRSANVGVAVDEVVVCHGVAYAGGDRRNLARLDEATGTWSGTGLRDALKPLLPERDDTDDVHSIVAGARGPIVAVSANSYHASLVLEHDGTAWRSRGQAADVNALAYAPAEDLVYAVGERLTALPAKGAPREVSELDDEQWAAAWVDGLGLVGATLADVSRISPEGELTVVLPWGEGEVPHNHSLFASGPHVAFVRAGKVWVWDGARWSLAFGEPAIDRRAERATKLVTKAMKGKPARSLERFALGGKELKIFPLEVVEMTRLRSLSLASNDIPELPDAFGDLVELEKLDLSYNHLTRLPATFGSLAKLRELNLHLNAIAELPESFGDLAALEVLDLGMNTSLRTKELAARPLTEAPTEIARLTRLRKLDLSVNELRDLPASYAALVELEELAIWQNQLAVFPRVLLRLPKLRTLLIGYQNRNPRGGPARVGGDRENEAPDGLDAVCELVTLERLDLDRLNLPQLPAAIGKLSRLVQLDLAFNKLKTLPASFYELRALRTLNLSYNPISAATKAALAKRLPELAVTY